MKFLIINRPSGRDSKRVSTDPKELKAWANQIREWLGGSRLECAYHMVSGGHVYVVNVESIDELQWAVRDHPLFEESHTEVIPITDAADFLDHYAAHVESGRIAVG